LVGQAKGTGKKEGISRWEGIFAGPECDYTMEMTLLYSLSRSMAVALKDLEGKIVDHVRSGSRTLFLA